MDRECICKIRDIYRNIAAFEAQLQRQLHLNMNDAMLLCIVAEHENISSGELADELQLTPSNASKVIASLEILSSERHVKKTSVACALLSPKMEKSCWNTLHVTHFNCPNSCKV